MLGMISSTCLLLIDIVNLTSGPQLPSCLWERCGLVLSRAAGEEGEGEGKRSPACVVSPHLPAAFRNGSLLLPLKEREKTFQPITPALRSRAISSGPSPSSSRKTFSVPSPRRGGALSYWMGVSEKTMGLATPGTCTPSSRVSPI